MLAGQPQLVYLDSGATSQTPQPVLDAMNDYYNTCNANIHRGVYQVSTEATKRYEATREKIAAFIGAQREELIFTSGATMSLNLLAYSLCSTLKQGDEVVTTLMEHHSNFVPWQQLAKQHGFTMRSIGVTPDGRLNMEEAAALISPATKIVTFTHMSNALGTINPAKELCALAHRVGAVAIVDGAQSIAHMQVDVKNMNCDFFVFSGHKMFGPKGIGCLYGKATLLKNMQPFLYGGDMISEVTTTDTCFNELPYKFEAGTPNIADAIGLGAAVDYIQSIGIKNVIQHEAVLTRYALDVLKNIPNITFYGPQNASQYAIISFNLKGIHAHDVATLLDREHIAVRAGHHCAMPFMTALGVHGTVRVSLSSYNTKEDIDKLHDALLKVQKIFK